MDVSISSQHLGGNVVVFVLSFLTYLSLGGRAAGARLAGM